MDIEYKFARDQSQIYKIKTSLTKKVKNLLFSLLHEAVSKEILNVYLLNLL